MDEVMIPPPRVSRPALARLPDTVTPMSVAVPAAAMPPPVVAVLSLTVLFCSRRLPLWMKMPPPAPESSPTPLPLRIVTFDTRDVHLDHPQHARLVGRRR